MAEEATPNVEIRDLPQLMTARQAASVLSVSERQIARMCEHEKLPAAKVGRAWRINRDALAARYGI